MDALVTVDEFIRAQSLGICAWIALLIVVQEVLIIGIRWLTRVLPILETDTDFPPGSIAAAVYYGATALSIRIGFGLLAMAAMG